MQHLQLTKDRHLQIKQKMTFESETDTEVIPKLCMYVYNNLTEPLAFSEVTFMLGTYAFLRSIFGHCMLSFDAAARTCLLPAGLISKPIDGEYN